MDWDKPRNNRRIPHYQTVTFLGMQYLAPKGKKISSPSASLFPFIPFLYHFRNFLSPYMLQQKAAINGNCRIFRINGTLVSLGASSVRGMNNCRPILLPDKSSNVKLIS